MNGTERQPRMRIAPNTWLFTFLLGVCAGLPALSIDLSAPTLTILPAALDTSTAIAGQSLSLFMVGFAFGQFTGGRSSDQVGRRPVLLLSIIVYVLSGICCSVATTGPMLVAARLIQGAGAGACAVQAVAMVQDKFTGEAARRKQSYISVILTILPMLAPALGTLLIMKFGWRSVHVVLAIGGALLGAVIAMCVEETHETRTARAARGLGLRDSAAMLLDPGFLRLTLVNALSYGTIFAYIAGAPVVVMDNLQHSPAVYAALFAGTALALSAGAMANARLAHRGVTGERVIWGALAGQAAAAVVLVSIGPLVARGFYIAAILALLACAFTRGLLSPNLVHLAVSRYRDRAGLAAALNGLLQLLVGAAASGLVAALLARYGYSGVAGTMAVLACAAAATWRLTVEANRVREANQVD